MKFIIYQVPYGNEQFKHVHISMQDALFDRTHLKGI